MEQSHSSMISSNSVSGTEVYGTDGAHVGTIDHLMIDKQSGNVAYAVMTFGGFLGIGAEHYPIPWKKLAYDTVKRGYRTDITEEQLSSAPKAADDWYRDRDYHELIYAHYGVPLHAI